MHLFMSDRAHHTPNPLGTSDPTLSVSTGGPWSAVPLPPIYPALSTVEERLDAIREPMGFARAQVGSNGAPSCADKRRGTQGLNRGSVDGEGSRGRRSRRPHNPDRGCGAGPGTTNGGRSASRAEDGLCWTSGESGARESISSTTRDPSAGAGIEALPQRELRLCSGSQPEGLGLGRC